MARRYADSLFFLKSICICCGLICIFTVIPLRKTKKTPNNPLSQVRDRVKKKGKLRPWPAMRTKVASSQLSGVSFHPVFSHAFM